MKRVIINAICAFFLMFIQTNVDAAFGIQAMAQFGVIAAVLTGMCSMSMMPSAISMLLLAVLCDLFASGPVGLYAIAFMLMFGCSRALIHRFRSERVIAVMIFSVIMTVFFELLLALLYCAYYRSSAYLSIFVHIFLIDILLTALLAPGVMWLNGLLETLFSGRKKNGLT